MATFQSRDEIVAAYQDLLRLETSIHESLVDSDDDPDWEQLNKLAAKESELMEEIENHRELDPLLPEDSDPNVKKILETFAEFREKNIDYLEQTVKETENQIESLGQAHELMKHYMQGEKRFGRSMSQRFEREI